VQKGKIKGKAVL